MDVTTDPLKVISRLSVDVVKAFRGIYPDWVIQAFTFVGKYMTLAGLDKETKKRASEVASPEFCPLCVMYYDDEYNCNGCVLQEKVDKKGCGHQYDGVEHAVKNGTFTDVAFNLSRSMREILKGK